MDAVDQHGRPATLATAATVAPAAKGGHPPGPIIPPMPAVARSGKWPGVLRAFLAAHPTCEGCGRKAETAHHVEPFAEDASKELDPTNLAAVCVPCHFVVCHLGNWHTFDAVARASMAAHRVRVGAAEVIR